MSRLIEDLYLKPLQESLDQARTQSGPDLYSQLSAEASQLELAALVDLSLDYCQERA